MIQFGEKKNLRHHGFEYSYKFVKILNIILFCWCSLQIKRRNFNIAPIDYRQEREKLKHINTSCEIGKYITQKLYFETLILCCSRSVEEWSCSLKKSSIHLSLS